MSPDGRVLLFTFGLPVVTGIAFGIVPALRTSAPDLEASLRADGAWNTASRSHALVRSGLVIAQVALSLVLLVGAGLLVHSLSRLLHADVGFNPDRLLTMNVSLPISRYATPQQQVAFFDEVVRRVSAVPGVESASVSNAVPPMKKRMTPMLPEGEPEVPLSARPVMIVEMVSPQWFATLGVPLRAGRAFTARDIAGARKVVIVNDAFARRFWPHQDAIGKHIVVGRQSASEVVGVAADVRNNGLAADVQPQIYVPFAQLPWSSMNVLVRTAADPRSVVGAIRQQVLAVDHEQPVAIATGDELLQAARSTLEATTWLLGGFSALALALALVGLYSVLAYSVAQRRRELAIRVALGADTRSVMRLVFGKGQVSALYHVNVVDPGSLSAAVLLFVVAAGAAMYWPARQAAATDVWTTLR